MNAHCATPVINATHSLLIHWYVCNHMQMHIHTRWKYNFYFLQTINLLFLSFSTHYHTLSRQLFHFIQCTHTRQLNEINREKKMPDRWCSYVCVQCTNVNGTLTTIRRTLVPYSAIVVTLVGTIAFVVNGEGVRDWAASKYAQKK